MLHRDHGTPSSMLCLLGAGDHARVVADAARASGWKLEGCWAPQAAPTLLHLGGDGDLQRTLSRWIEGYFHLAVGGLPGDGLRRRILEHWEPFALQWGNVIHPSAWVSPHAKLGHGVFVGPQAVVNAGASLGDHVLVNSAAVIEHDCVLETGVIAGPRSVCGGGVRVGEWAYLGLGSCVRDHVSVGSNAVVGMGAVVVGQVATGNVVMGVPARLKEVRA